MGYTKNTWQNGDVITAEKLNHMEGGIFDAGKTSLFRIGTVTTGDPGGQASVTDVGTDGNHVFDFVIPRGADGTNGAKGAKGDPGANGSDGISVAGLALETDADGKIIGGQITLSNDTIVPITVTFTGSV